MGRTAYESISGSMTTSTDHRFAPILNAARKVVFSRTLKTADWANTTIAAGDTAEEIDKLRQGGDGHIVVWGGVSLWRSLMRLDLIDELQLNPALRGWCAYFRPGVSAATFADLARYTRDRFMRWARRKHRRITVKTHPPPLLQRRTVAGHHRDRTVQPGQDAHHALPLPGSSHPGIMASQRMNHHGNPIWDLRRARCRDDWHAGFGRRLGETHQSKYRQGAPSRTSHLRDARVSVWAQCVK